MTKLIYTIIVDFDDNAHPKLWTAASMAMVDAANATSGVLGVESDAGRLTD